MDAASKGSLADVYIDVGGIVKQSEGEVDSPTKEVLQERRHRSQRSDRGGQRHSPAPNQIEIDLSSELGGKEAPSGDVSKLLGSLPGELVRRPLGFADFSEQFEEAIDNLDEDGIPPDLEPGELKSALEQAGIDLDKIAASLDEAAVFVEGSNADNLGGAMVVTPPPAKPPSDRQPRHAAPRRERAGHHGRRRQGERLLDRSTDSAKSPWSWSARATGSRSATACSGADGASTPAPGRRFPARSAYKAAVSALGKTPISGFVDGPAALQLAEAIVPHSKKDFWEAAPYLKKISYVGIGSGSDGESTTAKIIAGIGR